MNGPEGKVNNQIRRSEVVATTVIFREGRQPAGGKQQAQAQPLAERITSYLQFTQKVQKLRMRFMLRDRGF